MYKVNHSAYCGMSGIPACFDEEHEARAYAAARLRRYRALFPVTTLKPGEEWEILEPENCVLVPDACGTLALEHVTFECRECGSAHETPHDALRCCAEYQED